MTTDLIISYDGTPNDDDPSASESCSPKRDSRSRWRTCVTPENSTRGVSRWPSMTPRNAWSGVLS